MFRIRIPNNPAEYFTDHLAKSDYYLKESALETVGHFRGKLADKLGLDEKLVDAETFRQLLAARSPQGEKLCTRIKKDRREGWDFSFDVPKSISLAALSDSRIEAAFKASVLEVMAEIEAEIMARVRVNGQSTNRVTGNLIFADFLHRTTRPLKDGSPDPQWHIHIFVPNITYDSVEQKYKAVELGHIWENAPYWTARMDQKLALKLQALGYPLFVDGKRWGIAGIEENRGLILKFSRRREDIDRLAEELGIDPERLTSELREKLATLSRKHKGKNKLSSLDALREVWHERMTPQERATIEKIVKAAMNPKAKREEKKQDEPKQEQQRAQKEQARAEEKAKEETTKEQTQGQERANSRQHQSSESSQGAKQEKAQPKKPGVSQDGQTIIRLAKEGIGRFKPLGGAVAIGKEEILFDTLMQQKGFASLGRPLQITIEQLLSSSDQLMLLRGKSSEREQVLNVARDAIISLSGKQCFMMASSSVGQSGNDGAFLTLDRVLTDESVQQKLAGQVLMVQDASALSKTSLKNLLEVAQHHQFRVILAGGVLDKKVKTQLISRDLLYFLEKSAGLPVAVIGERGKDPLFLAAMEHYAKGDLGRMAELLQKIGMFQHVAKDAQGKDRTCKALADYYIKQVSEGRNPSAIVAGWQDRDKITHYIRDGLKNLAPKQQGSIKKCKDFRQMVAAAWSDEQKTKMRYEVGQFIEFHKKTQGFTPAHRYKVTAAYGKFLYLVPEDKKTPWIDKKINEARPFIVSGHSVKNFSVYRDGKIELGVGDKITITKSRWTEDYNLKLGVNVSREGLQAGWKKYHKRVERGLEGTVVKLSRDTVTIKDQEGKKHTLSKDFGHWKYGYVTNRGQGGVAAHHSESSLKQTMQRFYGMLSRWSENIKIFSHDLGELRRGLVEGMGRTTKKAASFASREESKAQTSEQAKEQEAVNAARQRQDYHRREKTAEYEKQKRTYTRAKHASYQTAKGAKPKEQTQQQKPQERGRQL